MYKMSSQDTRRQIRLNELMESRIRRNVYVRFGGECLETYHREKWQGAGCLAYDTIYKKIYFFLKKSLYPHWKNKGVLSEITIVCYVKLKPKKYKPMS